MKADITAFHLAERDIPQPLVVTDIEIEPFAGWWDRSCIEERLQTLRQSTRSEEHRWYRIPGWWHDYAGEEQFAYMLFEYRNRSEIVSALWAEAFLHEARKDLPTDWRGDGFAVLEDAQQIVRDFLVEHDVATGYRYNARVVPEVSFRPFASPSSVYQLGEYFSLLIPKVDRRYQVVGVSEEEQPVVTVPKLHLVKGPEDEA